MARESRTTLGQEARSGEMRPKRRGLILRLFTEFEPLHGYGWQKPRTWKRHRKTQYKPK